MIKNMYIRTLQGVKLVCYASVTVLTYELAKLKTTIQFVYINYKVYTHKWTQTYDRQISNQAENDIDTFANAFTVKVENLEELKEKMFAKIWQIKINIVRYFQIISQTWYTFTYVGKTWMNFLKIFHSKKGHKSH